jgi:prefoldin subunit 5
VAPTAMHSIAEIPRLKRRGRDLRREIAELRAEIAETRRLNQRVAELTDLVAEVLVPLADRDDARVQKALETFARTAF